MSIGENIKTVRKDQGLTQKELAQKANISRSYLADIENGRYNPSIEVLQSIASSLGISAQKFFKDNLTENDNIDQLEDDLKLILSKIKKISKSDREKLLKMIDIFEEETHK
ncbi:helix-turn-helix domain-containing protein [Clostridium brassicae]|uniref:Helix-turn-helix transcriptional regulator n=1 Tax=Clostridium brassicae TaxID=2999072 RepID=A0ABT4D943_9CLOT|nr:helix-turn-helix transcriptional regulator [Clostridium brassicae]MCY6958829.1 helix-turn-helix transcriptional regulator [Clostridium brassicae]